MVLSGLGRAGAECHQCPGPGREGCVPAYRLWGQNPAQAASNCRESSEASSHNASAYGLPALHAVLTESWGSGGGGGGSERLQGTPTVCPALGFSPLMISRGGGGHLCRAGPEEGAESPQGVGHASPGQARRLLRAERLRAGLRPACPALNPGSSTCSWLALAVPQCPVCKWGV